jgi:hypothetical protein
MKKWFLVRAGGGIPNSSVKRDPRFRGDLCVLVDSIVCLKKKKEKKKQV